MSEEITEFPTKLNPLPEEQRVEKRAAMKSRRAFAATNSAFVRAMREAMGEYLKARTDGVSREDAVKGLEHVLRDEWPKQTTKFPACEECDGTGWEYRVCRQYMRCERESCHRKGDDWQHRYVVACSCPKGDRFRARVPSAEDAFAQVGKSPKRKTFGGFTKI